MKLSINGEEYDVADALNNVSLGNLDILQKATREAKDEFGPAFAGITRPFIKNFFATGLQAWQEANPNATQDDLFGEEDFRRAIIGIIFLARRRAGTEDTVADARNVLITEFKLYPDDEEPSEVEVPKDEADTPGPTSPTPTN